LTGNRGQKNEQVQTFIIHTTSKTLHELSPFDGYGNNGICITFLQGATRKHFFHKDHTLKVIRY